MKFRNYPTYKQEWIIRWTLLSYIDIKMFTKLRLISYVPSLCPSNQNYSPFYWKNLKA